ncbi:MAG: Crp/Fnr family transcriptional regulator [Pseudolabrys sp.]|nr:Crp/Fnr family transcriptional regulator [Pseudolabrys sp.]MBV9956400.1 Crp/Fnr family transcriptional regulator [Pseudolabrys sp.]
MALVDALLTRLEAIAALSDKDRALLASLKIEPKQLKAGEALQPQGSRPSHSALLIQGTMARLQEMTDGARQIVSFHLPGEIPDLHSLHIERMDHTLSAVRPALVGTIAHDELRRVIAQSGHLGAVLWRETLIDAAVFRQWITNNGKRGSLAGMAHLLCELFLRAQAIGQAKNESWEMPFTQAELGEAIGITSIHANRILKQLKTEGAAAIEKSVLHIIAWDKLQAIAGFDATYLHLKRVPLAA